MHGVSLLEVHGLDPVALVVAYYGVLAGVNRLEFLTSDEGIFDDPSRFAGKGRSSNNPSLEGPLSRLKPRILHPAGAKYLCEN